MTFTIRKKGLTPVEEKKKNPNKETIWVDMDGTLAKYGKWESIENIGEPIKGAAEFTKALSEIGKVGIYTTRTNAEINTEYDVAGLVKIVQEWCDANDIYYDEIYAGEGKPIGSAYVDDRAVECAPEKDENAYADALERVKALVEEE